MDAKEPTLEFFTTALIAAHQHTRVEAVVDKTPLVLNVNTSAHANGTTAMAPLISADMASTLLTPTSHTKAFWTFQYSNDLVLSERSASSTNSDVDARLERVIVWGNNAEAAVRNYGIRLDAVVPLLDGVYSLYTYSDDQKQEEESAKSCRLVYRRRVHVVGRYQVVFANNADGELVLSVPSACIDNYGHYRPSRNGLALEWHRYQPVTHADARTSERQLEIELAELKMHYANVTVDTIVAKINEQRSTNATATVALLRRLAVHTNISDSLITEILRRLLPINTNNDRLTWQVVAREFAGLWQAWAALRSMWHPHEYTDYHASPPHADRPYQWPLEAPFHDGLYVLVCTNLTEAKDRVALGVFELITMPEPTKDLSRRGVTTTTAAMATPIVARDNAPSLVLHAVTSSSWSNARRFLLDAQTAPFDAHALDGNEGRVQWYGLPVSSGDSSFAIGPITTTTRQERVQMFFNNEALAMWLSSLAYTLSSRQLASALTQSGALTRPLANANSDSSAMFNADPAALLPANATDAVVLVLLAMQDGRAQAPLFGISGLPTPNDISRPVLDSLRTVGEQMDALVALKSDSPLTTWFGAVSTEQQHHHHHHTGTTFAFGNVTIAPRRLVSMHVVAIVATNDDDDDDNNDKQAMAAATQHNDMADLLMRLLPASAEESPPKLAIDEAPYVHPLNRQLPGVNMPPLDVLTESRSSLAKRLSAMLQDELATGQRQGFDTTWVERLRNIVCERAAVLFWLGAVVGSGADGAVWPRSLEQLLARVDRVARAGRFDLAIQHRLYRVVDSSDAYYSYVSQDGVEHLVPLLLAHSDEQVALFDTVTHQLSEHAVQWMRHVCSDYVDTCINLNNDPPSWHRANTPLNVECMQDTDDKVLVALFIEQSHTLPLLYEVLRRARNVDAKRRLTFAQRDFQRWFAGAVARNRGLYTRLLAEVPSLGEAGFARVVWFALLEALSSLSIVDDKAIVSVAADMHQRTLLLIELAHQYAIVSSSPMHRVVQVQQTLDVLAQVQNLTAGERRFVEEFWLVDAIVAGTPSSSPPYEPPMFREQPREAVAVYPLLDDLRADNHYTQEMPTYWNPKDMNDAVFAQQVRSANSELLLRLLWASYVYGRLGLNGPQPLVDVPQAVGTPFASLFSEAIARLTMARPSAPQNMRLLVSSAPSMPMQWQNVPWFDNGGTDGNNTERVIALANGYVFDGAGGVLVDDDVWTRVTDVIKRRNVMRPRYLPLLTIPPRDRIRTEETMQRLQREQAARERRRQAEEAAERERQALEEAERRQREREAAEQQRRDEEEAKRRANEEAARLAREAAELLRQQQEEAEQQRLIQVAQEREAQLARERYITTQRSLSAEITQLASNMVGRLSAMATEPLAVAASKAVRTHVEAHMRDWLNGRLAGTDSLASDQMDQVRADYAEAARREVETYGDLVNQATDLLEDKRDTRALNDLQTAVQKLRDTLATLLSRVNESQQDALNDALTKATQVRQELIEERERRVKAEEAERIAKAKAEEAQREADAAREAARKAEAEAEAKRKADAEMAARLEAEAERQRKAQEDAKAEAERKAKEEKAARVKAEAEAEAKRKAEADGKAQEEAEAKRKANQEAEAKRKAQEEAEAKRKAQEEAEAKRKADEEAEAERKASVARLQAEAVEKQRLAEEANRKAEEATRLRQEQEAKEQALRKTAEEAATTSAATAAAAPTAAVVADQADIEQRIREIETKLSTLEAHIANNDNFPGLQKKALTRARNDYEKKNIAPLRAERDRLIRQLQQPTKARINAVLGWSTSTSPTTASAKSADLLEVVFAKMQLRLHIMEAAMVEMARLANRALRSSNDLKERFTGIVETIIETRQTFQALLSGDWRHTDEAKENPAKAKDIAVVRAAAIRSLADQTILSLEDPSWQQKLLSDDMLEYHKTMAALFDMLAKLDADDSSVKQRFTWRDDMLPKQRQALVERLDVASGKGGSSELVTAESGVRMLFRFRVPPPLSTADWSTLNIVYPPLRGSGGAQASSSSSLDHDVMRRLFRAHARATTKNPSLVGHELEQVADAALALFDNVRESLAGNPHWHYESVLCYEHAPEDTAEFIMRYPFIISERVWKQLPTNRQAFYVPLNSVGVVVQQLDLLQSPNSWAAFDANANRFALGFTNRILGREAAQDIRPFYDKDNSAERITIDRLFADVLTPLWASSQLRLYVYDTGRQKVLFQENAVKTALEQLYATLPPPSEGVEGESRMAVHAFQQFAAKDDLRTALYKTLQVPRTAANKQLESVELKPKLVLQPYVAMFYHQMVVLHDALLGKQAQAVLHKLTTEPFRLEAHRVFLDVLFSGVAAPDAALYLLHRQDGSLRQALNCDGVSCMLSDYVAHDLHTAVLDSNSSADKKKKSASSSSSAIDSVHTLISTTNLPKGLQDSVANSLTDTMKRMWNIAKPNPPIEAVRRGDYALQSWALPGGQVTSREPPIAFCYTLARPDGVERTLDLIYGIPPADATPLDISHKQKLATWFINGRRRVLVAKGMPFAQLSTIGDNVELFNVKSTSSSSSDGGGALVRALLYSSQDQAFVDHLGKITAEQLFDEAEPTTTSRRGACYWLEYSATTLLLDRLALCEKFDQHAAKFQLVGNADAKTQADGVLATLLTGSKMDPFEVLFQPALAEVLEQLLEQLYRTYVLHALLEPIISAKETLVAGQKILRAKDRQQKVRVAVEEELKQLDTVDGRAALIAAYQEPYSPVQTFEQFKVAQQPLVMHDLSTFTADKQDLVEAAREELAKQKAYYESRMKENLDSVG